MGEPESPAVDNFSFLSSGFIGSASGLLSLFLLFFESSLVDMALWGIPAPAVLIVLTALILLLVARLNDDIANDAGGKWVLAAALVGVVIAPLTLLFAGAVFLPFIAVGVVATVLLWGSFLSTLTHKTLAFFTSIAFMLTGIFCLFFAESSPMLIITASVALGVISWTCALLVREQCLALIPFTDSRSSREHNVRSKGNRYTLFTIGLVLGSAGTIITFMGAPTNMVVMVLGIATVGGGVFTLILRRLYEHDFEDAMRKSFAVFVTAVVLPIPFLPLYGQLACAGLLLFFAISQFIILIDAVAETARFNIISPVWIIGTEGAICMAGATLGAFLFWWGVSVCEQSSAFGIACFGLVLLCSLLQISVAEQAYPFMSELREAVAPGGRGDDDAEGSAVWKKAAWRMKLNAIAREKGLSPRQKEVMELLAKGRDSKYIQDHFVISRSTAKTHVYNLYQKLGVHSRQDLIDLVENAEIDPGTIDEQAAQTAGAAERKF